MDQLVDQKTAVKAHYNLTVNIIVHFAFQMKHSIKL